MVARVGIEPTTRGFSVGDYGHSVVLHGVAHRITYRMKTVFYDVSSCSADS